MESTEMCREIPDNNTDQNFHQDYQYVLTDNLDFSTDSVYSILGQCFITGKFTTECKRVTSSLSSQEQSAYLLCLMIFFCSTLTVAASALPRIPSYQDVEVALETTRCSVRDVMVDIREIHTTLPPDAKFMPSCVLLRRCTGCCQSDLHRCMPTSIYTSRIEISQQLMSSKIFNYITLNFTHHAECACQSPVNPTCIPRVCPDAQVWNKDLCQCEDRCAPRECGHRQVWNRETCRCQCQQCHPNRVVHSRFLQDEVTCLCACRNMGHGRPRCRKRARFSLSQCTCVGHRTFAAQSYRRALT